MANPTTALVATTPRRDGSSGCSTSRSNHIRRWPSAREPWSSALVTRGGAGHGLELQCHGVAWRGGSSCVYGHDVEDHASAALAEHRQGLEVRLSCGGDEGTMLPIATSRSKAETNLARSREEMEKGSGFWRLMKPQCLVISRRGHLCNLLWLRVASAYLFI
jgi:hypothetical protein